MVSGGLPVNERYLNGIGREEAERIRVIDDDGQRVVLVDGHPYMKWKSTDGLMERIAMVQLYHAGIGTVEQIGKTFFTSARSIRRWIRCFEQQDASGLIEAKRGPKGSWKLTPELRARILYVFFKEGVVGYDQIVEQLQGWDEGVSATSVRQVLVENGLVGRARGFVEEGIQRELFEKKEDEGQRWLEFHWDREPSVQVHKEGRKALGATAAQRPARRSYSRGQRMYVGRLEQGEENAYAGGLLLTPFLPQYLNTLGEVIPIESCEGYSFEQLCQTLFYVDVFGFRSMEDFKRAYAEEFGVLIGRRHSPSHYTLRRFLHKVREVGRSEKLMEEFARLYLQTGLARWGVLYIDAHFLPYYGMYPIAKGWHGVRQIGMKGSYQFLGVDERFMPWMFLVRSSSEDLLGRIPEMIEKAEQIAQGAGIGASQREQLTVVFDREGYSGQLYGYLDGRDRDGGKKRVIFVSWAKYADRWVYEVPQERFSKTVVVKYEIRKPEELKYHETQHRMSKYGMIRTVVIERQRDGKRMAIYTNGSEEEIRSERVVEVMCRRWGQENLIKELMWKHGINYTPGYVRERMEEQPLVVNPRAKELNRQRGNLASELHKLKVQLADKILKEATDETNWQEIKQRETELLTEIVSKQTEMQFLQERLGREPKEVRYDVAHEGRELLRLNYEKKRFLDCVKVYSYNVQRQVCELLMGHYGRRKEILSVLSMIVKRGGYVKLTGGRLRVRLRRFKNPEVDYAARRLCEEINRMNPMTMDKYRLPIHFQVS